MKVGAVGILGNPKFASEVLEKNEADVIFLARPLLKYPNWVISSAIEMEEKIDIPKMYERGF